MAPRVVSILIVGDMMVQRPAPESMFALAAPVLREADILFGNLEFALSDVGEPLPGLIMGARKSDERMVAAYTSAGFDVVALANNHIMDFGPAALIRTIEILDQAGIAHAGGGRNLKEAHRPAILERNGTRVAFLAYSSVYPMLFAATKERPGIATVRVFTAYEPNPRVFDQPGSPPNIRTIADPQDVQAMVEDMQKAKQASDVVVVAWHWGVSQGFRNMAEYQVAMGHAAIDAGADLVVGHHPHVLQAVEAFKGGVVCHSIAQFGFDPRLASLDEDMVAVRCRIEGNKIAQVSLLPATTNEDRRPRFLEREEGERVARTLEELSKPFGTQFHWKGSELVVETR